MKQETVQSVVHDLRTPMTVIKGYLQLLASGMMGSMTPEQMELIQRSISPLDDMIMMTENLLQASSLDGNQPALECAETDLDQLISEMVNFYQLPFQQRGMQILRDGNTLGEKLYVDPFWMKRVLQNLIWNAYKFTPDNGKVRLHVNHEQGGLTITVSDNGRGIPKASLGKLFQKFEQVFESMDRKIGTGLGLWICKRVMELHGGDIHVKSVEGSGSHFIISIPASRIL